MKKFKCFEVTKEIKILKYTWDCLELKKQFTLRIALKKPIK